ncbi:hypothetical protein Unana1_02924 [Umbelopsis nana]
MKSLYAAAILVATSVTVNASAIRERDDMAAVDNKMSNHDAPKADGTDKVGTNAMPIVLPFDISDVANVLMKNDQGSAAAVESAAPIDTAEPLPQVHNHKIQAQSTSPANVPAASALPAEFPAYIDQESDKVLSRPGSVGAGAAPVPSAQPSTPKEQPKEQPKETESGFTYIINAIIRFFDNSVE